MKNAPTLATLRVFIPQEDSRKRDTLRISMENICLTLYCRSHTAEDGGAATEDLPRILRLRDVLLEELELLSVLEILELRSATAPSVPNTAEPTADALPAPMRA